MYIERKSIVDTDKRVRQRTIVAIATKEKLTLSKFYDKLVCVVG